MNGTDFVELLKRISYPKAEALDKSSFDWMFENESTLPFLNWLCDEVGTNNVLTETQLKQYEELCDSGEGVLDGKQLEEALHSIPSCEEEKLSEERLREEISELEYELEQSQKRKEILVQQRDKLSLHQSVLNERLYNLGGLESVAKSEYKQCVEQSQADNTKLNASILQLRLCVTDLTDLYVTRGVSAHRAPGTCEEQDSDRSVFLSQLPLNHFTEAEDKFTQQLTAYTRRLFFQGLSELAGHNEGTRYEILEVGNPNAILLKGATETVNLEDCKDLARLQAFFSKSEAARINAGLTEKSFEAACMFVDKKLHNMKEQPYPKEIRHLRDKLQDCQNTLGVLKRDETVMTEQELPRLLKDSAKTQLTQILSGDYNLKITRQDYFTSNQDKVIEELVSQRSRNELLTMAYEAEDRGHRETHRLLTALNMVLKKQVQAQQNRMSLLKEPSLQPSRHQRNTVDSRDKFLMNIHQLLGPTSEEDKPLFVSHSQLTSQASSLSHQVSSMSASLAATHSNHDHRLAQMEKSVGECQALVYSGSSTSTGQPALSPQPIHDALVQLDGLVKKLEQVIMDVIKDVDTKKKTLKADPLLSLERELFVCFFTDPQKLRRVIDDLEARLNAQLIR